MSYRYSIYIDRKMYREKEKRTVSTTERYTESKRNKQTDRETDKLQRVRHTDRQAHKQIKRERGRKKNVECR